MRFCLMIEGQENVSWPQWITLARTCERLGFDALFRSDHYLSLYEPTVRGSLEAWSTIAALAAQTRTLRLGTLVTPVTMRHPATLGKVVATADHISQGRVELGLGAGWYAREHQAHGFLFPDVPARFDLLEEHLQILHGLYTQEDFSHTGQYVLDACTFLPKPWQRPAPPIILGGKGGPRLARLVARYASEYNSDQGTPDEVRQRIARVASAVEGGGRDPGGVTMSLMTGCIIAPTAREYRARAAEVTWRIGYRGATEAMLAEVGDRWVLGTPEQAIERIAAFADAGVQRIMLQHHLPDDLETLELLASEVLCTFATPQVATAASPQRDAQRSWR